MWKGSSCRLLPSLPRYSNTLLGTVLKRGLGHFLGEGTGSLPLPLMPLCPLQATLWGPRTSGEQWLRLRSTPLAVVRRAEVSWEWGLGGPDAQEGGAEEECA